MELGRQGCINRRASFSWRVFLFFVVAGCQALLSATGYSGPLGMVSDNARNIVSVIDSTVDAVAWTIPGRRSGHVVGDCAVDSRETLGMATNSSGLVTFIEMAEAWTGKSEHPPPTRAVQRVTISNLAVDLALSPDDRWLVAAGGGAWRQPLVVIDVEQRREISTSRPFWDHTSVEYCDDGTLLITTIHGEFFDSRLDNALYDARLRDDARIELLGGRLAGGGQPNNAACAPGATAGVMLDRQGSVISFTLPGLRVAQVERTAGDFGVSAAFSPNGRRLYIRTSATVEAFEFNPFTGALQRDWTREMGHSTSYYGIDQIAVHPHGDRVYVDGGDALHVLRAEDGSPAGLIGGSDTTGVCFARIPRHGGPGAVEVVQSSGQPGD